MLDRAWRAYLPGILRTAVRKAVSKEATRLAHEAFREATDPVLIWLTKNTVRRPEAYVSKATLLERYNADSKTGVENAKSFTLAVRHWWPEVKEGKRGWKGQRAMCWLGVGLKEDDAADDARERTYSSSFGGV